MQCNVSLHCNSTPYVHCVPKKHVTTSSTISWTKIIHLQQFLACLLSRL